MRARISLIIEEDLLARVDLIAGEQKRRSGVIEQAIREFIAREELKGVDAAKIEDVVSSVKL